MTQFEGNELLQLADRLGASFITRAERLYAPSWWNYRSITADYTATLGDVVISGTTTGGSITITLPTLASSLGKIYVFNKNSADANTVTIDGNGSETIDGATTRVLSAQFDKIGIISNGATGWRVMWSYSAAAGYRATADATVANTTTETSVVGTGSGSMTVAADTFIVGNSYRLTAYGKYSTDVVAPTGRFKMKLGSVIVCDTGAVTYAAGAANGEMRVECYFTVRSLGATGTVYGHGLAHRESVGSPGTMISMTMGNTGTATIDTTASTLIDLTFTWGTAHASNTITMSQAILEIVR